MHSSSGFADAVGVQRQAVSQWKSGKTVPNPENLRTIARVTRIPYETLALAVMRDMGYLDVEYVRDADHESAHGASGDVDTSIEAERGFDPKPDPGASRQPGRAGPRSGRRE